MNKDEKVSFDLSKLSLDELIEVYKNIDDFLVLVDEKRIVTEEKVVDKNE